MWVKVLGCLGVMFVGFFIFIWGYYVYYGDSFFFALELFLVYTDLIKYRFMGGWVEAILCVRRCKVM